ncbi:hypothetical protein [Geminocystis sp. NIES-3709]|uniref:hypothetical protein n=1 Tax=Geminocystis sp. NIES-3709 TaxID=1617448 RepID=UPI0005FC6798|nr:hypothetical protein [Geminocystis sp. NIES-3709]BAQ66326.1 hypothetical protein GM3709_3091 [Geminocystis sp. NIES-3709]
MNKSTIFSATKSSPNFLFLSLTSIGVLISPIFTLNAFANIDISIDPYNDSGFDTPPVISQPQATKTNSVSPTPINNQSLPTQNLNNNLEEIFINGNPTPSRPNMVSGNVIKSNKTLPQIPPLSEPYRNSPNNINPNSPDNEAIESQKNDVSVSSLSPFDGTPQENQDNILDKKIINNSNSNVRSINISPNSTPQNTSNTPTVENTSIVPSTNPGRRRSLNDILVLSNSPTTPQNNQIPESISSLSSSPNNIYKVLVRVNNQNQESQVKSLYPEAFRANVRGQSMLQVGVFSSPEKAQEVSQSFKSIGLDTELLTINR